MPVSLWKMWGIALAFAIRFILQQTYRKSSKSSDIFPTEDPASSYNTLPGQVKGQKEQIGTRASRSNSKLQQLQVMAESQHQ